MALVLSTAQGISTLAPYVVLTILIVEMLRQSGKVSSQASPYAAFLVSWGIMLVYTIAASGLSWTTPFRAVAQGSEVAIGALALYDTVGKPIKKAIRRLRGKKS